MKKAVQQGLFKTGAIDFDFEKIQARKNDIIGKSNKGIDYLFRKNKVTVIRGSATLLSAKQNPRLQGTRRQKSKRGTSSSRPVRKRNRCRAIRWTKNRSSRTSALWTWPLFRNRLSLWARAPSAWSSPRSTTTFGTKVTLLEALPQLVPLEDEEVAKELRRVFTRKGIDCHTSARLESAKTTAAGVEVAFLADNGERKTLVAEKLLMATGRAPNTSGIGLEALGISMDRSYIKVDRYMQTNVPGVYAIGDVVPTPQLAHVAFHEGIVAVERIAGKNPPAINYLHVPNCTYCDPQIASVGLTEAKAVAAGHKVKTGKFPFTAVAKARIEDATDGFVKIVANEEDGEILGVHMIGSGVTEMIAEGVTAMGLEGAVADMEHLIHAHPTLSEGVHEALEAVFGAAIHI